MVKPRQQQGSREARVLRTLRRPDRRISSLTRRYFRTLCAEGMAYEGHSIPVHHGGLVAARTVPTTVGSARGGLAVGGA